MCEILLGISVSQMMFFRLRVCYRVILSYCFSQVSISWTLNANGSVRVMVCSKIQGLLNIRHAYDMVRLWTLGNAYS